MKNELELGEVIELLNELQSDDLIPKNVRSKLKNASFALTEEGKTISLRVDKSIQELDSLSEDPNIPIHTKVQLWDLFSKLECIQQ